MSTKREKVVVAMSGGVDSSVAACLLIEQGYDVVGLFMRVGVEEPKPSCPPKTLAGPDSSGPVAPESATLTPELGGMPKPLARACDTNTEQHGGAALSHGTRSTESPVAEKHGRATLDHGTQIPVVPHNAKPEREHQGCCSASDAADARFVAGMLDVPFFALNFQSDFDEIIDYFVDEYARGRTPNPCVVCNDKLKFGKLLDYADAVGAKYIATGHYARIEKGNVQRNEKNNDRSDEQHNGGHKLLRGVDQNKDQSYVLFGLGRDVLDRVLFPVGELNKSEVRDIAKKYNLPNQAKPDSVEICFVPDRDYARVVKERRPDAFASGEVIDQNGKVLGQHEGVPLYTIGQRRGLGIAAGKPIYVTELNVLNNTVTVGESDALLCDSLIADRVNRLTDWPDDPFRAMVKIRYLHKAAAATIYPMDDCVGGMPKPKAPACDTNAEQHGGAVLSHGTPLRATHEIPVAHEVSGMPSPVSNGGRHESVQSDISEDTCSPATRESMPHNLSETVPLSEIKTLADPDSSGPVAPSHSIRKVRVVFDEPQRAVAPGQAVVFYDGDVVLGGAWIVKAEKQSQAEIKAIAPAEV